MTASERWHGAVFPDGFNLNRRRWVMRKIFFTVLAVLLLSPLVAFGADIKKGDTARVPGWERVDVKNLDSVRSGNSRWFSYGDTCGIQRGGIATVVGIDGNRVFVRYSIGGTMHGT